MNFTSVKIIKAVRNTTGQCKKTTVIVIIFQTCFKIWPIKGTKNKWNLKTLVRLENDLLFPKVKSKNISRKMVTWFPNAFVTVKNKSTLHYDI